MMSNFHVGQKVVCINGRGGPREDGDRLPVEGVVYTVRWVGWWPNWDDKTPDIGVRLMEIVRPTCSVDGLEHPWGAYRFRPVAYPKQSAEHDIGIFTHHLTKIEEVA